MRTLPFIIIFLCICILTVTRGAHAHIGVPVENPPEFNESYVSNRDLYTAPNDAADLGPAYTPEQLETYAKTFVEWVTDGMPRPLPWELRANKSKFGVGVYATQYIAHGDVVVMLPINKAIHYKTMCTDASEEIRPKALCSMLEFIREDRPKFLYPGEEIRFKIDDKHKIDENLLELALILAHLKFASEDFIAGHAAYFMPYVDLLPLRPDVPLCSFTPSDLEIFPWARQVLQRRDYYMREMYDYVADRVLPKFPGVFGTEGDPATDPGASRNVLTPARLMWATCQVRSRFFMCNDARGEYCLHPVADHINHRRANKRFTYRYLPYPPKTSDAPFFHVYQTKRIFEPDEEILMSYFLDKDSTPGVFLEYGIIEDEEKDICGLVQLPLPNETLWTPCVTHFFSETRCTDILSSNDKWKLAREACIRQEKIPMMLDIVEKLAVYNKTCTVYHYNFGKYQRRSPMTKFHAAQFLSLLIRGQLRRTNGKIAQIDAILRKKKQAAKASSSSKSKCMEEAAVDGGAAGSSASSCQDEQQKQEQHQQVELPPNIDMIRAYNDKQRTVLSRMQAQLGVIMQEQKAMLDSGNPN